MTRTVWIMTSWFMTLAVAAVVGSSAVSGADELPIQAIQLLKSKCFSCHGPEQVESGLRLDSREALLKGGERGAAVVERNPAASLLFQCVTGESGEELRMPPKNPLSPMEIELLKRWLSSGALWPERDQAEMEVASLAKHLGDAWSDPQNPIVRIFGGERLDLWSLKPIRQPVVPETASPAWCRNEIDHFVSARFEAAQVALPTVADRHTLLRRIHFDLTGLPPAPEFVANFESNTELDIERLMDQLLSSEQFGMHWPRLWLDVARYSDSNGFDWDEFRPQAYRYRDYVIRSFNQDKPYDRFLAEQLAGDEMFDGPPRNSEQQDALIATGFLRMGPHDNAAKLFNEQDRSRDELLTDLVETTSGAMLGLTMSCCRCHDHKFDPVSQADYFRFRAFFAGVKFADDLPIDLEEDQAHAERHNGAIDETVAKLETESIELLKSIHERIQNERGNSETSQPKHEEFPDKPELRKQLKQLANDSEKQRLDEIETAIKQARNTRLRLTHAMLMVDDAKPPATFVLYQGDYKAPRQIVSPGVLSILDPNELQPAKVARRESSGRRMALANWIAARENPLTARVLVNRVWQQLMGQGLVATPGDFGLAGSPPADPELLDWLALRFTEDGWSIKRLVRTVMLSSTYRQAASYKEPVESLAYATRKPRRLTAEQLRDAMLVVSGLLTNKNSGPPQWPDLPREVLEANPAFLDDNETKTKGWYPSPVAEQACRSIFLVQKRNTRVPLLETLDQPDNSVPCQRRQVSIVAPQALSLLNSPLALAAAKNFSQRIGSSTKSPAEQIKAAFALALQRQPTTSELAACQQLLERADLTQICRALLNVNEFAYID